MDRNQFLFLLGGLKWTLALSAIGSTMPTLEKFDSASDRQRWLLRTP